MTPLLLAALIMSSPITIKGEAAAVNKIASDMRFVQAWACESADVNRFQQVLLILGGISSTAAGIFYIVATSDSDDESSIGMAVVPVTFSATAIIQFVLATQHGQAANKARSVCGKGAQRVKYRVRY